MQVDEIRPFGPDQPTQAADQAQVQVAAHGQFMHPGMRRGGAGDRAARRAGQHAVDPRRAQAAQQEDDLQRAAVEVAAGFDVEHFHAGLSGRTDRPVSGAAAASTASAAAQTDSAVWSRMQSKRPSQLGRRRQGEQLRPL